MERPSRNEATHLRDSVASMTPLGEGYPKDAFRDQDGDTSPFQLVQVHVPASPVRRRYIDMQDGPSVEYDDRQTSPDDPKRSTAIRFMNESDRMFETIALAESLFYFLIFLPRRYLLQRPVVHPAALPRAERRDLFCKCLDTVPDVRNFLRLGSQEPQPDVRRENVKEWFCWAFMNRATWDKEEDDELEEYVRQIERLSGEQIPPGRGEAKSLPSPRFTGP
ncbi:MAG: hypothetical protein Q9210_004534 [Variospora velana]